MKGFEEKISEFREALIGRGWFEEPVREEDRYVEPDFEEEVEDEPEEGLSEQRDPYFKVTPQGFTGVEIVTRRTRQLVATFESDQGDLEEIVVVHDVNRLKKDTEFSGRIYRERVKRSVETALALFELDNPFLQDVLEAVEEALKGEGIRFYED